MSDSSSFGGSHPDDDPARLPSVPPPPPPPPPTAPAARASARRRTVRNLVEWAVAIGGALAVAWLVQAYLFQAFVIPSASMEPTLVDADRVMVNKQSYRSGEASRGDVVVFRRPPDVELNSFDELIKRVIAVGGQTVEARGGVVLVDGVPIDEPYLDPGQTTESFAPIVVPPGELFVMGDNRGPAMSFDSRFFGTIPEDLVVGRAFAIVWPPSRWTGL